MFMKLENGKVRACAGCCWGGDHLQQHLDSSRSTGTQWPARRNLEMQGKQRNGRPAARWHTAGWGAHAVRGWGYHQAFSSVSAGTPCSCLLAHWHACLPDNCGRCTACLTTTRWWTVHWMMCATCSTPSLSPRTSSGWTLWVKNLNTLRIHP